MLPMRGDRDEGRLRLRSLKHRERVAWDAFFGSLDTTDYAQIYRLMLSWLDLSNRREALEVRLGVAPPALRNVYNAR